MDDDRPVADTLSLIFSESGYSAKSARSADDALRLSTHWAPDLAIIDVMLPGMDGIALAIAIKEKYPNCRILLFSAYSSTEDFLAEAKKDGHDFEILPKPVHPRILLETAKRLLA